VGRKLRVGIRRRGFYYRGSVAVLEALEWLSVYWIYVRRGELSQAVVHGLKVRGFVEMRPVGVDWLVRLTPKGIEARDLAAIDRAEKLNAKAWKGSKRRR